MLNIDKQKKAEYDRKRRQEKREEILLKKRAYYQKNKDKINAKNKIYRDENKDKINEVNRKWIEKNKKEKKFKSKIYYEKNKEKINAKNKIYRDKNKDKIRTKARQRQITRINNDISYRLARNYRSIVRTYCLKQSTNKNCKTFELLGCSGKEFKLHIESLWEPWMNWENYGIIKTNEKTWQIDHIIPVSHFDLTDIEEAKKAFHYTNCRPLCSFINISEGDRR